MEPVKRGRGRPRKVRVDDTNSIIKKDGFMNAVVGHGTNRDPMKQFGFVAGRTLDCDTLTNMYMDNKLVQKIIKSPADEATKHWIEVEIDGDESDLGEQCEDDLDRLNTEEAFNDALTWSRLYGGSAVLMIIDDGGELDDPLDEANIRKISHFKVYDRSRITFDSTNLYTDPSNINYGMPEYYTINPIMLGSAIPFKVHESRLLLFKGDVLPDKMKASYHYWGMPVLQGMFEKLLRNEHGEDLGIKALERLSQAVMKLDGMSDMLQDEEGEAAVKKRLDLIDMARSIINTIALDKEDEYDLKNISLSQVPEMMDRYGVSLSAVAEIPFTVLFGRSPAGMNATGESDLENYYNMVAKIQKRQLRTHCERIAKLSFLQKEGFAKGVVPDKFKVCFKPLWLPSDKEKAETEKLEKEAKKIESDTATAYINAGVLTADEVRQEIAKDWDITGSIEITMPDMGDINNAPNNTAPNMEVPANGGKAV